MDDDDLQVTLARGWSADWLNGWLAAIGATVLLDGLRLSWTDSPRPLARLHHRVDDLPAALYAAMPTLDQLAESVIARHLEGEPDMPRNFGPEVVGRRARRARLTNDWSLGASVTDLLPSRKPGAPVEHSAFDVPVPQGRTLHDRVLSCREAVFGPVDVSASLAGTPARAEQNGLGFDARRIEQGAVAKGVLAVDPVVEILAWVGLAFFPVSVRRLRTVARSWRGPATREGSFVWGSWQQPLDRWGIDARIDQGWSRGERWGTVPYQPTGSADATRAYASRAILDD